MFSIISSEFKPQYLLQLREWLLKEWGKVDAFDGVHPGLIVPPPIIVINDQTLVGGLAFTSHAIPEDNTLGVWINALIVAPKYRGEGIGSQLVLAAEVEAKRTNLKEIFVYSNIPALYEKLGWKNVDSIDGHFVLKKTLTY